MTAKLSLITRDTAVVVGIKGYPTAISDGFALDFSSPIPLSRYRQQKRWREVPTETLRGFLKGVEGNITQLVRTAHCRTLMGLDCYRYSNNTLLQQKYVDYFLERYPKCQLWASPNDPITPIAVKQDDILVGLVMPVQEGTII